MPTLPELPTELVLDVFLLVPTLGDALSLSATCTRLREIYSFSETHIIDSVVCGLVEWPARARELYDAQLYCDSCEIGPTTTLRPWEYASLTPASSGGDAQDSSGSGGAAAAGNSGVSRNLAVTRARAKQLLVNHRMVEWTRRLFERGLLSLLLADATSGDAELDEDTGLESPGPGVPSGGQSTQGPGSRADPPALSAQENLRFSYYFYRCLTITRYFNHRTDSAMASTGSLLLEQFRTTDILCIDLLCRWLYHVESREEVMENVRAHIAIDDFKFGFYWLWSRIYGAQKAILVQAERSKEQGLVHNGKQALEDVGGKGQANRGKQEVLPKFVFFDRHRQASLKFLKDESLGYWQQEALSLGYPVI